MVASNNNCGGCFGLTRGTGGNMEDTMPATETTVPAVTPEPVITPLLVPSRYINYADGLALYVYGHDGTTIVDILRFKRNGTRFVPDGWE